MKELKQNPPKLPKAEIAEALRVAFQLSGVGSLYTASFALGDLLERTEPRT